MSRARHKEKADGGVVAYNAKDSNVMKEAHERKRGGKVMKVEGEMSKPRGDRPGRKRGGRIGADKAPLSSAAKVTHVTKGELPEEGADKED